MSMYNDKTANDWVTYDSDDLVYNRFDLIYKGDYERFYYKHENQNYRIDAHYEGYKAVTDTWGKCFPQDIFESVVDDIFQKHPEVRYIEFNRAGNDYGHLLSRMNDIRIPIPGTAQELMMRLKPKHRYNLKRAKRLLEENCGPLAAMIYEGEIPDELIDLYFAWKKTTHGTDYGMRPDEYLQKYHVTHAMTLQAGGKDIGVLFYCAVNDIVYLENLSYQKELEKFSVGYITYVMLLEELVRRGSAFLYLGGGDYIYKKHFGSQEHIVYSGAVYNDRVFEEITSYFLQNGIKRIAIYGLGACGNEFLRIRERLGLELVCGIDRGKKEIEGLTVYTPEEDLPDVDAVLVTLNSHNADVESFIKVKSLRYFYWNDLARNGICQNRGGVRRDE